MTSVEDLFGFALFERLSTAQLGTVAQAAQQVDIPAGTLLFEEGQVATGCWLIRAGQVALTASFPGRGPAVVQTLGPGDVLGWSWLVPPHHWHFTATASKPVAALRLDTVRLQLLAEQDPALGYPLALGIIEVLLARLQSTRSRLLDLYGSPREH